MEMKSEFSQKLHKETQISLVTRAVETDMIIFHPRNGWNEKGADGRNSIFSVLFSS